MTNFADELIELIEKYGDTMSVNEVVSDIERVKLLFYHEALVAAEKMAKIEARN